MRLKDFAILMSIQLALILMLVIASVYLGKPDTPNSIQQYASIFPFSDSQEESYAKIIKAGGSPVRYGLWGNLIVSASKDPEYRDRLLEQGALLVFDPIIKGSCVIKDQSPLHVAGR